MNFIIEFKGVDLHDYAVNFFDMKTALENFLKRQIDLGYRIIIYSAY